MNFKDVFQFGERKLMKASRVYLKKRGYGRILSNKNYLYAEGNIPVMLVAHLDTVHHNPPKNIFHDQEQGVYWSPEGLGADDRAGVWAILQISNYFKPYILFTTGEEKGGIGASVAARELPSPPVNFIIELDRQGSNDAVFYQCDNGDFTKYITSFGFEETFGTFSDISIVCPRWGIAGVNLSIGYYGQHTKSELLVASEMNSTIKKVCQILSNIAPEKFEYLAKKYNYSNDYMSYYYGSRYRQVKEGEFRCWCCGEILAIANEAPLEKEICTACYDRYLSVDYMRQ